MNSPLSRACIIIPAHNRPERLKRLLNYYRGCNAQIIVADSSDTVFMEPEYIEDCVYLHFPRLHFLKKIQKVLPLIDRPYVLYVAEDDFTVKSGIARILDFLDRNPSYTAAQGHYLTFETHRGKMEFSPRYIRRFDSRIVGETPHERILLEKDLYTSLLYAVVRSSIFKEMYGPCFLPDGNLRFENLFLAEEYFNHAVLIYGNYATIPCFYSAREYIPGSATFTTTHPSVIKSEVAYRDEYEGFITSVARLLSANSGTSLDEELGFIRQVSDGINTKTNMTFKQRVLSCIEKHPLLSPLNELALWRYRQKGYKAVKGMESYPCTFQTPEKDEILQAIASTKNL